MILNISEDFIAANIRPLEGALEDMVLNVGLCMQGYERMAFAATIGAPFFSKYYIVQKQGDYIYIKYIYNDYFSIRS